MPLAVLIASAALFILYTEAALYTAKRGWSDKLIVALYGAAFPVLAHALFLSAFGMGVTSPAPLIPFALATALTSVVLTGATGNSRIVLLGVIVGALACFGAGVVITICMQGRAYWPTGVAMSLSWHACVAAGLFKWSRSVAKSRRNAGRLCAHCEYDLRALPPTTTRCPECGAEFNPRPAAPE